MVLFPSISLSAVCISGNLEALIKEVYEEEAAYALAVLLACASILVVGSDIELSFVFCHEF